MPWNALGRGNSAILAQHYPAPHPLSPAHWKTLSTKGPKLSARIWKNNSVSVRDSRVTGEMLGHKMMAMAGWYVEKATTACRGEVAPQQHGGGQERVMRL